MGNKQEKPGSSGAKTLKEKKNVVGLAEHPVNSYQGAQNRDELDASHVESRGYVAQKSGINDRWNLETVVVSDPDVYIARHDYCTEQAGQLSIMKGDCFTISRKSVGGDWSEATNQQGKMGWVPSSYIGKLNSLEKLPWFHGNITRAEAELCLKNGMNGSFLVRESESTYSISLCCDGRVFHYVIIQSGSSRSSKFYVTPESKFETLAQLVAHHSKLSDGLCTVLRYPVPDPRKPPLHSRELDRSDIEMGEELGEGLYGVVYKALLKGNTTVAVRELWAGEMEAMGFLDVVSVMQVISHPCIVQLLGVCSRELPFLIVMEYMPKGNLWDYLCEPDGKGWEAMTLVYMAQQVASAMEYLESMAIVHRNLQSQTCLVGEHHQVKLGGFTKTRRLPDNGVYALEGGVPPSKWTAPESYPPMGEATCKSDVWEFGVLLWEIESLGLSPYPDVRPQALYGVLEAGYRMPPPEGCPPAVYRLIRQCWEWEPENRPSFKEVFTTLNNMDVNIENAGSPYDAIAADTEDPDTEDPEMEGPHPRIPTTTASKSTSKRGEKAAKKLFDEAMEKGYVESRAIVLLLLGAAGAGKSHFKHLILRLPPPAVRESTPLAEAAIRAISICRATISDGDMEWQLVSSQELLRMVADAIKAGVPVRLFPLAHFPVHELPQAVYSDLTQITQPDVSLSQSSSKSQRSAPPTERAPVLPTLDPSPSPRSVSSMLKFLDLGQPSQVQLEKELVDLISQSSGSRKLFDVDWVYIVDSGGQPQFHEILPAFVRYASACVFVMKLDKCLTDHPTIEYYGQGGQRHGIPYRSLLTHEQILQHCFQALQSRRCISSSPQSGPMVFVAGTHKDLEHHCPETRDAKNKKLLESLRPVFGDKLGLYRLGEPDQLIFPVNAKTPSREDEKVACEFRKMVTTSCPYEREKIPIPWFVLEQLIRQYATEKGASIVSTKECRQIAQRLHMGEEAFHAALDYLVALNIFHYYPTILPDVVFCDTQVLPDKMSELVEYSHMLRGSCGSSSSISGMQSHSGGWLRFRDEGIITVEFLREFPKHYVAGLFTPSDLLKLLRALLITAHLAGGEYFMPSLLYELQPDELDHYRCSLTSSPSPLLVHYPGGWLPSGIFTSLIAYLQNVSSWKLLLKSGKPDCLHRNCVKFRLPGGRPGSITLIDSFTHFEVHLVTPKPVSPSLCSEIRRAIFDGLKQAVDTLSYTNLHPKEAFFCSARGEVCEPTPHLAVVGVDRQWWSCSVNPEVGGELTEGQTLWFSSADDEAEELKLYQPPKPPTLSKPHSTPHPMSCAKSKQLAAADPTEKAPSLADKPKLYQLQCLQCRGRRVKIIETVAAKWEEVALALHFEGHTIQNIRYDPHIQCIDTACRVMLQKWLDREGCQPVNWKTLMDALIDIGFVTVVEDLQEILRN